MATKTAGFTKKYEAQELFIRDKILADDVEEIAELKGFTIPLSEAQRTEIKEFVNAAKQHGLTIKQAVELASQSTEPAVQQQSAQPHPDVMGSVTEGVSANTAQQNINAFQQALSDAKEKVVIEMVALDLVRAQAATGLDLSDRPDLQAMLDQSGLIRQKAEASSATLLPFDHMAILTFGNTPLFKGKLPALPAIQTLTLAAAQSNT